MAASRIEFGGWLPRPGGRPARDVSPRRPSGGNRWQTVGSAGGIVVLFVVHTEPVEQDDGREIGRVVSVRKATGHERKAYEEGTF